MKCYDGQPPNTAFSKIIGVIRLHDENGLPVWKIELNIPYVPSLFTCNLNFATQGEAIRAAINVESKLNRLVNEWNRKKGAKRK